MFKNLFNKLVNNKLVQQDERDDYLDAVNRAKMLNGGNGNVIATPEQANLLNQQLQKINNDMGVSGNLENITPVQANNNNSGVKSKLANYLLGEKITPETQSSVGFDENGDVQLKIGTGNEYRTGGALRDFSEGFRENRNNPISLENFGENKNFATRLGEGFGSVARFADTPLGRALIVSGLVGATGGSGLEALAYGATAGANNQKYRNEDKMFRNDLINTQQNYLRSSAGWNELSDTEKAQVLNDVKAGDGYDKLSKDEQDRIYNQAMNDYLTDRQQKQLNDVADNINSQRGYMTNDVYNNLIRSQQIRDNAEFRNMQLANQQEQNRLMNEFRKDQFKAQEEQRKFNNYIAQANLQDKKEARAEQRAYNNAKLNLDYADLNYKINKDKKLTNKQMQVVKDNQNAIAQIDRAIELIKQNKNAFGPVKGTLASSKNPYARGFVNNNSSAGAINARSAVADLKSMTVHDRSGSATTATELALLNPFLADLTDNADVAINKLQSQKEKIQLMTKQYIDDVGLDFGSAPSSTQTVGKYKVTVK